MAQEFKYYTPVYLSDAKIKIDNASRILTMGSCFSQHIGERLKTYLFNSLNNPFGTIFNPVSLSKIVLRSLCGDNIQINEIHQEGERCFHYDFHTSFDTINAGDALSGINLKLDEANKFMHGLDYMIITFGTSIAHFQKGSGQIVSNCHKVPSAHFTKRMLSIEEMFQAMSEMIEVLLSKNPKMGFVLTVSPVRHTKQGLIDNSRSKARLVELSHLLEEHFEQVGYFPSFELMMDELRDYRFYNSDLIHPSEMAVDIIWSKFIRHFFEEKSKQKVSDIEKLILAKNHLPFNRQADSFKIFQKTQLEYITKLSKLYAESDFSEFVGHFQKQKN